MLGAIFDKASKSYKVLKKGTVVQVLDYANAAFAPGTSVDLTISSVETTKSHLIIEGYVGSVDWYLGAFKVSLLNSTTVRITSNAGGSRNVAFNIQVVEGI